MLHSATASSGSFRVAALTLAVGLAAGIAQAQTSTTAGTQSTTKATQPAAAAPVRVVNPAKDNLSKMMRTVTIEFTDQRLEDVITFLKDFTGAEFEPEWQDGSRDGLDKDQTFSLSIKNLSALETLERVLSKVQTTYEENGWQMTSAGTIQFGPKSMLNRDRRMEIYDINDLLTVLPRYDDAPTIDLEQVLQSNEGGGGTIFEEEDDEQQDLPTKSERAQEIVDLIVTTVEPVQWVDNGGSGGTIRYYNGTLIVNAPDYIHRQINGYSYWPSYTASQGAKGRRYVTLTGDASMSTVDGFAEEPVVTPRP